MRTFALLAAAAVIPANAFVLPLASRTSGLTLKLKPEDADQLVAAYDASLEQNHGDEDDDMPVETNPETVKTGPTAAARSFVSRVFKLPSEPHPEEEDVVLYPIVGFTFVMDEDHNFRALPKKTNVSCRLIKEEPLYGYFHPPKTSP